VARQSARTKRKWEATMVLGKQKLRLILSILVAVVIAAALFHPTAPSSAATVRVVVRGETLAAAKAAVVACSGTVESEITIIELPASRW